MDAWVSIRSTLAPSCVEGAARKAITSDWSSVIIAAIPDRPSRRRTTSHAGTGPDGTTPRGPRSSPPPPTGSQLCSHVEVETQERYHSGDGRNGVQTRASQLAARVPATAFGNNAHGSRNSSRFAGTRRRGAQENVMSIPIERIVVPTDFGVASEAAVAYAGELAVRLPATVHLVHVMDELLTPEIAGAPAKLVAALHEWLYLDARAKLARAAGALEPLGVRATSEVRVGLPMTEIVLAA